MDGELGDEVIGHFWSKLSDAGILWPREGSGEGEEMPASGQNTCLREQESPARPFVTLLQLSPVLLLFDGFFGLCSNSPVTVF